jgi:hypothetical protein
MSAPNDHGLARARMRAATGFAGGLAVAALGWAWLVWSPRAALPILLAEEQTLAARIEAAKALPPEKDVDATVARLRAESRRIESHLETLGEARELAHTIRARATACGLEVRSEGAFLAAPADPSAAFRPNGHGPPLRFRKRLLLAGEFGSLRRFLAGVEELPDLIRVAALDVKRAETSSRLEIDLELEVTKAAPTVASAGRAP